MLKRLYIDNFRALVNTDLALERRTLLMGANGTGKSTFADVLLRLQWLISGISKTDEIFTSDTLTRWQNVPRQRFELDVTGSGGDYHYEVVVEHRKTASAEEPRTRIVREVLKTDSDPLFHFEEGLVHLYRDDHSAGPEYPFDWGRSALGTITPRGDNQKLTWFVRWLRGLTVLRPNPPGMLDLVERDDFLIAVDTRNFAAWYHMASSGDKRHDRQLHDDLVDVLPGFDALNFEAAGPNRWLLRADFSRSGEKVMLRFGELSDGQRALILLYAVARFLLPEGRTVLLDEPDNYVSLDEIQPWLLSVTDIVDGGSGQLVLVSHHPEIFNQWAESHGTVAERESCGPIRTRKFSSAPGVELLPAEAVARGWTGASGAGGNGSQ
ncbi:MAG TPA: AAA family ATPase [Planctomycetaceae bacterium]|nr:AAA family ATPase [Planctomycetaceae bacterium]